MRDNQNADLYWRKAIESLAGAESELSNGRFNNAANRAYYAILQAAIAALLREGISSEGGKWPHTFVQSEFVGKLINRRHKYPPQFRQTLAELQLLRHRADYDTATISRADARDAIRRSRELLDVVRLESDYP